MRKKKEKTEHIMSFENIHKHPELSQIERSSDSSLTLLP
jgi:hypothetical protein